MVYSLATGKVVQTYSTSPAAHKLTFKPTTLLTTEASTALGLSDDLKTLIVSGSGSIPLYPLSSFYTLTLCWCHQDAFTFYPHILGNYFGLCPEFTRHLTMVVWR